MLPSKIMLPLLMCLFLGAIPAHAGDTTPPTTHKTWPETFFQAAKTDYNEFSTELSDAKVRMLNSLFFSETLLNIFQTKLSPDVSLGFAVERDVYNNFDAINSVTVVDHLKLNISNQFLDRGSEGSKNSSSVGIEFPFAGISFTGSGSLEIRDITQLSPEDLNQKTITAATKVAVQSMLGVFTGSGDNQKPIESDVQEINPYLNSINFDSSYKVKLHDILNPITMPFRLPLNRSDLHTMKDGEILSYTISGQLGFGGTVGWNVIPLPGMTLGTDLKLETHLKGEYEIAVQRINSRYARVRVSRVRGHGESATLSAGLDLDHFFKGFFILKGTKFARTVGDLSYSIVPFTFQLSKEFSHELDIAYRYDLDSPVGRDAFHRAVLGDFVVSDDLSVEESSHPNPSVAKIFERTSIENTTSKKAGINLSFLFNHNRTLSNDNIDTQIILPNGTKQLFKSTAQDLDQISTLNCNGRTLRQISVMVDQDDFKTRKTGSLVLVAENIIDDPYTSAKNLNKYAKQVEDLFQDPLLFPIFPKKTPKTPEKRAHKIKYGRSSFYYGFSLREADIQDFLNTDIESVAEKAETLGIRKINRNAFAQAKQALISRDPVSIYQSLTAFFSDRRHTQEYMKLVLAFARVDKTEKFLVAQNNAFGNIQNRGMQISAIEKLLDETSRDMGVSSDLNRSAADPSAIIQDLSTKLTADRKIEVHFTLASSPEFLFFRLTPLAKANKDDTAVELLAYNRNNRFKQGENTLILDPDSTDPLIHKLTDHLDNDEIMMLSMGYTHQNQQWGTGTSTQFSTNETYSQVDDDPQTNSPTPAQNQ